jgi:simple sugar transport system ATP-binding protein
VGRAPAQPLSKTANFSGGNQQKLVIAREVEQDPDVLLVGQPTRGVDIGAIEYIHQQIIAMRDKGKAVLLVSVELDEIMSLSDRIWSSPTAASSASWMPPRRMNAPSV